MLLLRSPSAPLTLSALRCEHRSCWSHSSHWWVNTAHTISNRLELGWLWLMMYVVHIFCIYGDSVTWRRWRCLVRVVWLIWEAACETRVRFHRCLAWSICHTHHDTEVLGTTDLTSSCSVVSSRVGLHAWTRYCTAFAKRVHRWDCIRGLCPEVLIAQTSVDIWCLCRDYHDWWFFFSPSRCENGFWTQISSNLLISKSMAVDKRLSYYSYFLSHKVI